MIWALPLAGMALGALQGKQKADREAQVEQQTRNQRSAEQRYSPWTGHAPSTQIQYAQTGQFGGMLGGGLQGGMAGAGLGQSIEAATQPKPLDNSPTSTLKAGMSVAPSMAYSGPDMQQPPMGMGPQMGFGQQQSPWLMGQSNPYTMRG